MRLTAKTLIGLSLLSTGCGVSSNEVTTSDKNSGVAEKSKNSDAGLQMNVEGAFSVDTKSKEGVKLPDDFPSDVILPSNAKPIAVMTPSGAVMVTLEFAEGATKSLSEISKSITSSMLENGWEEKSSSLTDAGGAIVMAKEKRLATFQLAKKDGKILAVLTVTLKK